MASNNETTTKFKVDISELKSAMQEAKRQIQVTNSEFKAISSGMDNWAKSTDGISAKLKQLDSNLSSQKTILSSLEKQYELTVKEMGEGSAEADRLKIAINNQKAVINGTEKEISKYENALDEVGTAEDEAGKDAEDLGKEVKKAGDDAKGAGDGFTVFKGVLANLATQGINLALDGIKSLGSAMVSMVKESVSAYADYEQLTGGVETLFKDSASTVMEYANNAYKTAGLSANEYMETVTSFSASLLSSLGGDTAESAKVADMAITDMSDNANKMGTDMESVMNAYNGFAKGQYNLLDNLKLGYGGTKAEMERLLTDAEKLSGQKYDINNLADVYNAIHVVQTELGITGTTAKEASTTIAGSVGMMKSAWTNLITGMADENANFDQLIGNLVDSVSTMLTNILPVATKAIGGLSQLFDKLAPVISAELPNLLNQILPVVVSSLGTLITSVISALKGLLPTLISSLLEILNVLVDLITDPELLDTVINGAIELFLGLLEAIPVVITKLTSAIPQIIESICNALSNPESVTRLVEATVAVLTALVEAIPIIVVALAQALPVIIDTILQILGELLPKLWVLLLEILSKVGTWLSDLGAKMGEGAQNLVNKFIEFIKELPNKIWTWLTNVITKVATWATNLANKGREAGNKLVTAVVDKVKELPKKMMSIGSNVIAGIWDGMNDKMAWFKDKITEFVGNVTDFLKKLFGIKSPSKLMAEAVGQWLPAGIAVGIDKNAKSVMNAMRDLTANTLIATRDGLTDVGLTGGIAGGVVNNFTQVINSPKQLSRLDIYRESKNLLGYAGGGI